MLKAKTKSLPKGGLTFKHKFGYALGDAGGCMTFALMDGIFLKYCSNALLIDSITLGVLLLVWNVWDFINDPLMGILMDKSFAKSKNPNGKFRPWILRSSPLLCISFITLFVFPTFAQGIGAICVLFVSKIFYEGMYTMFNIPMGSLLSAMSTNDHERAALSSARGIGSGIGNAIPLGLANIIVNNYGTENTKGYIICAIIFAVGGLIFCLGHYYFTEERVNSAPSDSDADNVKWSDILGVVRNNRPFLALCIHGVFICLAKGLFDTFSSFLFDDYYGGLALATVGMIISSPLMMVTYIFGPKLAKKWGLERFIRYGLIVGAIMYIVLFVFHVFFYVNPYIHMIVSNFAFSIASVSIYMQWGLVGEAIDYNEMMSGKRTEGSIYGTFNLSRRVGKAIAQSVGMFILAAFGYMDGSVQSDSAILGIKVVSVLLPGVVIFGSWAAFKFVWNMSDETRAKVSAFKESKIKTID